MNKINLVGRIGKDPEVRYGQSGAAVCSFSLAVRRSMKREGAPDSDWFDITAFGKTAEYIGSYCHKGDLMEVSGRAEWNEWTNSEGVTKKKLQILAESVTGYGRPGSGEQTQAKPARREAPAPKADEWEQIETDQDLPF